MRDFTSHLNGKIIPNPYTGSSFRHRKTMLRSCFNPQDIFPTSLTDDKLWWQTEQQWILGRPSAKTQRHVPYYQTRTQKNTTFWLILNDCLPVRAWMPTLYFLTGEEGRCGRLFLCHAEWNSSLLVSFWISLTLSGQLLDGRLTESWVRNDLCPGSLPEKRTGKTKLWQSRSAAGLCGVSVWGGWKHPCTHLTWFVWFH